MTTTENQALFQNTRWTRVRDAQLDSAQGRHALSELCADYYEPVLAFLRCRFGDADRAKELSHAFFAELLAGASIGGVEPGRGKFRAYLLGAVKHFVARHHQASRRLKRGAGADWLPLEAACEKPDPNQLSPEQEFDRQWAITLLARSFHALEQRCAAAGNGVFFEKVKPLLAGETAHGEQAVLAAELGISPETFRKALQRLRKQLRHAVKAEIMGTLDSGSDVQQEMEALFSALSR